MNQEEVMRRRPVLPLVLSMSLPMVLSMLVASLYNIVDSYYVAKISEDAMTALSLIFPVQNLINAVTIGFSIGANAVISYHLGARDLPSAGYASVQALAYNALHGLLLTAGCIGFMPLFLSAFTESQAVIDLGVRYSRIAFSFAPVIALSMSLEKIFQAAGKMVLTMVCMLSGCVANIVLDPVLIFGLGPFPQMGIEGAALATGLGQALSLLIYGAACFLRPLPVKLRFSREAFQGTLTRRIYSVGIPAALNLALPSVLVSALNVILSSFAQSYVLVLGVYYKLQTFLYLPANGIVQGIRPLVGYNFGAGEAQRVRRIYTVALSLAAGIMAIGTILCQAIPEQLIGLFSTSAQTVDAGALALRIISAGFLFSSVSVISCGALEGLGMGGTSLLISLLRYGVVMIPAAFVLSRPIGPSGVWHAFWVTELLTAAAAGFLYRRATQSGLCQASDSSPAQ